ncbi:PREDICTED: CKLF-like MARVEL transmembrane domain-containing protein 4 [Priapulus caudatus]|uniref:CKLF-like MARVEL transmembrane domain-containing protein 4 n=1 Tax=Priapulus caudatus TaxID=37621 RepID=A0ABM1E0Y5_PRICU|nr:PREDICTED: CKLF-like MARVEL transmembrane domain-containing protein 4 [Priapulus caudatus]
MAEFDKGIDTYPSAGGAATTAPAARPRWDISYIRTVPGLLKIAQVVISLIGFICCIAAGFNIAATGFFEFVSMTAFWVSLVMLFLYLSHFISFVRAIPWLMLEFFYCALWTLLYLISSIVLASSSSNCANCGGMKAASFFGFVATAAYAVDAFFKFRGWRGGDTAQEP